MGKAQDIQIDAAGEDIIKDGDFLIEDTTQQNQELLIICEKGENTMHPDSGVGIASWLLDEADGEQLKKEIQSEFEADGLTLLKLEANGSEIITVAVYGK